MSAFKSKFRKIFRQFSRLSWSKKIGTVVLLFTILAFLGATLFYQTVRIGVFGSLPSEKELANIDNYVASEVYSADGKLLGKYYIQERTHASFEEISPYIIDALISTEDVRFYEHDGVDRRSLLRVFVKTLLLQDESAGGGSTISQQLAKNLFPRHSRLGFLSMPVNKVREMIVAQRLENVYSKKEILTLYLNTVPFGDNAFGIETAAERFFNKDSDELNLQEAAMLVGMLKATYNYSPRLFPDNARQRRNVVIRQMEKYEVLKPEEADSLVETPLVIDYRKRDHNEGLATYFRSQLREELEEWCSNHTKANGEPYNLYTDGLKIYTTLDSRLQLFAEEAMREHMASLQQDFFKHWEGRAPWEGNTDILMNAIYRSGRYKKLKAEGLSEEEIQEIFSRPVPMKVFSWDGVVEKTMSPLDSVKYYLYFLNAGFLAMEPQNGAVKAWVGGINHEFFKYDHVNINTKRQVGSTFKPIVYAAALQQGADPCTYIPATRETYPEMDGWSPGNSDGNYEGEYTLMGGLMNSVNTVSVKVLRRTGLTNTINLARSLGISSDIPKLPSIALGTPGISLYEMVTAYCAFANGGEAVRPHYLLRIENSEGKVLEEFRPEHEQTQVLTPEQAALMVHMLEGVVNEGTASRLRWKYGLKNDIAGKTGTTQSNADGWFIGLTPNLVAGAWVGADYPGIHFRSTTLGQGANTALPIFGLFMKKVNGDKNLQKISRASFPSLSQEMQASLDCPPYRKEEDLNLFERIFGQQEEKNNPKNDRKPRRQKQEKKKKNIFERIFGN
ncbi:penicillin-binding protein 1A [Nafulsella turpanensis]|uniref:penicillin-binding protein 1A n=1 Tax=Nafulsella turpanensis TaxID=1265690 RepID=UPI00034B2EB0|nr:transglycosylase domain-containing protein [Nafulsella turpanensis]